MNCYLEKIGDMERLQARLNKKLKEGTSRSPFATYYGQGSKNFITRNTSGLKLMNESKLSLAPSEGEMVTSPSGEQRFMPNPNLAKINTQSNKIYLASKRASSNGSSPPVKKTPLKATKAVSNSKDLLNAKLAHSKA